MHISCTFFTDTFSVKH